MHNQIPKLVLFFSLLSGLFGCLQVEKKNQNNNEVIPEVQVYSQPQFILNEHMILTEDTIIDAERVYLTKNAAIYTKNFNLKIITQTLESELGAVITHFGYDQAAAINQNGRDGGLIEIKADTATGHLQLIASGERGGTGIGGWGPTDFVIRTVGLPAGSFPPMIQACTPGSGKNSGQSGTIQFETYNSQNLKLSSQVLHKLGGDIGPTAPNYRAINLSQISNGTYKGRDQNCTEDSMIGKPSYGGQVCTKLQNQNNFECIN